MPGQKRSPRWAPVSFLRKRTGWTHNNSDGFWSSHDVPGTAVPVAPLFPTIDLGGRYYYLSFSNGRVSQATCQLGEFAALPGLSAPYLPHL